MKKIISFISFVLVFVSCSNERESKIGEPPPPPGYDLVAVRFVSEEYSSHVLVEPYADYLITIGARGDSPKDYRNLYVFLHKNVVLCDFFNISDKSFVTNVLWKDFTEYKNYSYFSQEQIISSQPFERYYRIPRRAVPTLVEEFPISEHYPENIDFINALIDSGDIEQYRVDLGY